MKTKVLIVDDSALMRSVLKGIVERDRTLEVVGVASDPIVAWKMVESSRPDVITLDVEMPRMDGLTFLARLMRAQPQRVLMISSLTEKGCATTIKALELGAVDFVSKPKLDVLSGTVEMAGEIVAKIKAAARARVRPALNLPQVVQVPKIAVTEALDRSTDAVVAIGASTGGTEALRELLCALPADAPGIVVVQHMPAGFTKAFAERLDTLCQIRVAEAKEGDRVLRGHALIAPGNQHLRIARSGGAYRVALSSEAPVGHHRPSVDVMMESCARAVGKNAFGAILTGMGADGAEGLFTMKSAGARTAAQDEASCVVFGMPKEAIARGAADEVGAPPRIAASILNWARSRRVE
jgi:two-component system chemotaxis response regulator CheB